MVKALRGIADEHRKIFAIGCVAHWANLTLEDFLEWEEIWPTVETVKKITTIFRTRTPKNMLREIHLKEKIPGPLNPQLYTPIRWTSALQMFQFVQGSKPLFKYLFVENEIRKNKNCTATVLQAINDAKFWVLVNIILQVIEAFAEFTSLVQSDGPTLSVAYAKWCELRKCVEEAVPASFRPWVKQIFETRSVHFEAPIFRLAFHLDPQWVNVAFQDHERKNIEKYLVDMGHPNTLVSEMSNTILDMKAQKDLWAPELLVWTHAKTAPLVRWWQRYVPETVSHRCRELAAKVISLPASSAATERVWSAFGNACTKKRTRLAPERLIKSVYVNWNNRVLASKPNEPLLSFLGEDDSDFQQDQTEDDSSEIEVIDSATAELNVLRELDRPVEELHQQEKEAKKKKEKPSKRKRNETIEPEPKGQEVPVSAPKKHIPSMDSQLCPVESASDEDRDEPSPSDEEELTKQVDSTSEEILPQPKVRESLITARGQLGTATQSPKKASTYREFQKIIEESSKQSQGNQ